MAELKREGQAGHTGLRRDLGLWALVATAVCTVIGGGINVLTVEIQDKVPGIDGHVPLAFVLGAVPAVFVALAYAILASAMPRAGGGYIYISRGLSPFLGFLASFSKWWGFATAAGVIAYLDVSLLRAGALYAHMDSFAAWLETPQARLGIPLFMVWLFWLINYVGVAIYGWAVVVLMVLMLLGGAVMIVAGFVNTQQTFAAALMARQGVDLHEVLRDFVPPGEAGSFTALIRATVVLFFAYIGFEAASQAGGEARDPRRLLPRAFLLSVALIAGYYVALSSALYRVAPWQYVAWLVSTKEAEVSMPEIMGVLLPPSLAVFVALMAALALANDVPPMLLAASRLFFAWARDGVVPRSLAAVDRRFGTPSVALLITAIFATIGVIGCHLFGPVRMGVGAVVLALLFTYLCASASVLTLPYRNPDIYKQIAFVRRRWAQVVIGALSTVLCAVMLYVEMSNNLGDLMAAVQKAMAEGAPAAKAWLENLPACPLVPWLTMLLAGAIIFAASWAAARAAGRDMAAVFRQLPAEGEAPVD